MKTFNNLVFKPHPIMDGISAKMFFKNGYGISVVRFTMYDGSYGSYTDDETEFEVAVLKGNKNNWDLTYTTPITDDVIGHLQDHEVNEIMEKIQQL